MSSSHPSLSYLYFPTICQKVSRISLFTEPVTDRADATVKIRLFCQTYECVQSSKTYAVAPAHAVTGSVSLQIFCIFLVQGKQCLHHSHPSHPASVLYFQKSKYDDGKAIVVGVVLVLFLSYSL